MESGQGIFDFQLPIANWPLTPIETIGNRKSQIGNVYERVRQVRSSHLILIQAIVGSNPTRAANFLVGTVAER